VTFRHIVLTVAALAVLGLCIYLFLEVRATSATAQPAARVASRDPDPAPSPRVLPETAPAQPVAAQQPTRTTPDVAPPMPSGQAMVATPPQVPPEDLQKMDAIMSEANKAYDRGDFDEAKQIATRVLASDPANVRMLRILVSSWCIDGDQGEAQKHYQLLPPPDRQAMKTRCARYGITFTE
jgi:cytochrome c-type biogenesis protein CcmH/NrfG